MRKESAIASEMAGEENSELEKIAVISAGVFAVLDQEVAAMRAGSVSGNAVVSPAVQWKREARKESLRS